MSVNELTQELFTIFNNLNKIALIPDTNLIRIWKLNRNVDDNDFIDQIKEHFTQQNEKNKVNLINIQGICFENNKDIKFENLDIENFDRFIIEIKDNQKDPWFFNDNSNKLTNSKSSNKRSFQSFLNNCDDEEDFMEVI